jgi:6-phosphogluconolactonase
VIDQQQQFASAGETPFGFAFRGDTLIVSEAFGGAEDASAVSSYDLANDGSLQVISPSVPTTETAACWIAVTRNGRFAYASNTGSGTVSGYRVSPDGGLSLLDPDGITGVTGPGPIDMAFSANSGFLYTLNSEDGTISAFHVNRNGSLSSIPGIAGIPAGSATGLAAR